MFSRVGMHLDLDVVRKMLGALVPHHMAAGHQEQAPVALEEEAAALVRCVQALKVWMWVEVRRMDSIIRSSRWCMGSGRPAVDARPVIVRPHAHRHHGNRCRRRYDGAGFGFAVGALGAR